MGAVYSYIWSVYDFFLFAPTSPGPPSRCSRCRRITPHIVRPGGPIGLEGGEVRTVNHHRSFGALESSARRGCDLCRLFRQALVFETASVKEHDDLKARWPVRLQLITVLSGDCHLFCGSKSHVFKSYDDLEGGIRFGTKDGDFNLCSSAGNSEPWGQATKLQAKEWINNCMCSHHECLSSKLGNSYSNTFPSRLVDVRLLDSNEDPKLVLGTDLIRSGGTSGFPEYLTLSYCWGPGKHSASTTKHNVEERLLRISESDLPKTFQDAIKITRALGFGYLWIDALCIIQPTSDDSADWQTESAKMGAIYRNALCTIAASGAANNEEGCFLRREGTLFPVTPCRIYEPDGRWHPASRLALFPARPKWDEAVLKAPLNARAWVLQEHAFSLRTLHFTKHGLFWECKSLRASEFHPEGSAGFSAGVGRDVVTLWRGQIEAKAAADDILGAWSEVVTRYSSLGLTKVTDKLVAVSALANEVHLATGDVYLAGLWRSEITRSLMWYPHSATDESMKYRSQIYVAPSWSWASCNRGVTSWFYKDNVTWTATFEDAVVELESTNPFGQVHRGRLSLKGPLHKLKVKEKTTLNHLRYVYTDDKWDFRPCTVLQLDYFSLLKDFSCLQLLTMPETLGSGENAISHWVLLLEPTGNHDNEFRRVGTGSVMRADFSFFATEDETVHLV